MSNQHTSETSSAHSPEDASAQSSTERREGNFTGHGGIELFFQTWSRPGNSKTLVVTHGLAEHSECYNSTAESLIRLGWNVCAWDLRGHGRSDGKRGYMRDFQDYWRDLSKLLRFLRETGRISDHFALLSHSMGGLVTLRYLIEGQKDDPVPKAIALSSPLIGVALAVPAVKDFAARLLNRFAPTVTLQNEIRYEDLSRDTERLAGYAADPLRHDKVSSGLYLGILESTEVVKTHADRIKLPILIQAAGVDKIVNLAATREFFEKIGSIDKKLLVYDESFHEIFNDLDREKVFSDLNAFLNERV